MSRKAKRIYTAGAVGVLSLGVLAVGVLVWQMHVGPATAGEGPPAGSGQAETLDAVAWSDMLRLRGALRLTDQTLAAAGLGRDEAESALTKLLTWYEATGAAWSARRADVRRAKKSLAVAMRELRVGGKTGPNSAAGRGPFPVAARVRRHVMSLGLMRQTGLPAGRSRAERVFRGESPGTS